MPLRYADSTLLAERICWFSVQKRKLAIKYFIRLLILPLVDCSVRLQWLYFHESVRNKHESY